MLNQIINDRDSQIDSLLSENDDLSRSNDTAYKNLNESYDLISAKDRAIKTLESHL